MNQHVSYRIINEGRFLISWRTTGSSKETAERSEHANARLCVKLVKVTSSAISAVNASRIHTGGLSAKAFPQKVTARIPSFQVILVAIGRSIRPTEGSPSQSTVAYRSASRCRVWQPSLLKRKMKWIDQSSQDRRGVIKTGVTDICNSDGNIESRIRG